MQDEIFTNRDSLETRTKFKYSKISNSDTIFLEILSCLEIRMQLGYQFNNSPLI